MKLSGWHIAGNTLRTTPILNVENSGTAVKTFTFEDKQCAKAKPGQFLMLWIPGVDEIPLSILDTSEDMVSVAVKKAGEATQVLQGKNVGEIVGLRGPFGNSFSINEKKRILMVGGGTGVVPLTFLVKKVKSKATKLFFVVGAKTKKDLLFLDELRFLCGEHLITTTENGGFGAKCVATAPIEDLLIKEKFDMIYTCGPELMMRKVFNLAEKHRVKCEASLERLMRCAIGLCGSCVVGRYRVCKDGPVFTVEQLREIKDEFGVSKRDFQGRKVPL